jgi:hypothetical protein
MYLLKIGCCRECQHNSPERFESAANHQGETKRVNDRENVTTYSIIDPSSLRNDAVNEGIHKALVRNIARRRQHDDIRADLNKLLSCLLEFGSDNIGDGDASASCLCKRFRNSCSNTYQARRTWLADEESHKGTPSRQPMELGRNRQENVPDPAAPVTRATPRNSLPAPSVTDESDMLLGCTNSSEKLSQCIK